MIQQNTKTQVTHRQHYVWQKYLEPWTHNGKIWFQYKGQIREGPTNSILFGRDFYKFVPLNKTELFLFKEFFVESGREAAKKTNRKWLSFFEQVDYLAGVTEKIGVPVDRIDKARVQAGEEAESTYERSGVRFLMSLQRGDLTFFSYDDERKANVIEFFQFISSQFFRTKNQKQQIQEAMSPFEKRIREQIGSNEPINWANIYNYGLHCLADDMSLFLWSSKTRFHLTLLNSDTDVFLTSDQPVFFKDPTAILSTLIYPISPSKLLLITQEESIEKSIKVSEGEIKQFNELIKQNTSEFLMASSKDNLL
jgi:hypothetical protein